MTAQRITASAAQMGLTGVLPRPDLAWRRDRWCGAADDATADDVMTAPANVGRAVPARRKRNTDLTGPESASGGVCGRTPMAPEPPQPTG
jgi:hypothetical protein